MSTTTPPPGGSDPGPSPTERITFGPQPGNPFAVLPVPGNAELLVYLLFLLLLGIIALASNKVDAPLFVTLSTVATAAYLISRGIAKASRVLEH